MRFFSKQSIKRLSRKLLLELGYLLFLLLLLEGTLRLGGFLMLLPRYGNAEIDPASEKEYRILAVGESTTFGLGVEPEMSYPKQLERLLNEDTTKHAVVINTGIPAQTSTSILRNIEYQMLKYRPQLVLCLFGINDLNEALNDMSARTLFGFHAPDFIAHLRVYRLACVVRDYVLYAPKVKDDGAWIFFDPEQRKGKHGWIMNFDYMGELEANYRDIIETIRSHGSEAVMLSYLKTPEELSEFFHQFSEQEDIPFLDLDLSEEERAGLLAKDQFHPNEEGHRVMANRIFSFLRQAFRGVETPR